MDLQALMQQMFSNAGAMPMMMPPPQNGYGYGLQGGQQPFSPFSLNATGDQQEQVEDDEELRTRIGRDPELTLAMDLQALMQQMFSNAGAMPMMMPPPQNGYGYGLQGGQQPFSPFSLNGTGDHQEQVEDDDEDDEELRTLFCGNLDERVSEEILYEVFLQAGPIEEVRIPTDNTGRQRNFGFVRYQHLCAVPFALQLYQGLELYQKKVTVKQQGADRARQQQQSPSFGPSRQRNPFMIEPLAMASPPSPHHSRHQARHSLHGAKPYDRNPGGHNGDQRRRSDSSVMERNRPRTHPQQHHQHMQGGSRRSDQRHNNQRRLL